MFNGISLNLCVIIYYFLLSWKNILKIIGSRWWEEFLCIDVSHPHRIHGSLMICEQFVANNLTLAWLVYSLLQVFCDVAEIAEKTTNTGDIIRCWLDSVSVLSDIIQRISKLFEVFNSLVNKVLTWWGGLSIRYDWPPEVWHLNLIQAFLCRFTPWLHVWCVDFGLSNML